METTQKPKRRGRAEMMLVRAVSSDPNIRATVDDFTRGTIAQLGGLSNLTSGQRAMLLLQRIALGTIMRLQQEIDVAADAEIPTDGLARTLSRYLAVFRQGQIALGLARSRAPRGDPQTLDFASILEEYTRKKGA